MPISVLPPEILARVFHLLVREEMPLFGIENMGWIKVTHVCGHWRQVALDDSSLWAKIWGIPVHTKLISEMLARAKDLPLDIELLYTSTSNLEPFIMFLQHLSRTRQLRLRSLSESTLHSDGVRQFSVAKPQCSNNSNSRLPVPPISLLPSRALVGTCCSRGMPRGYGRSHSPELLSLGHSFLAA